MSERLNDEPARFASPRDELLYIMMHHEWAAERSGDIDAPTGTFAWMSNLHEDLTEIVDAFADSFNEVGLESSHALVGNFLLQDLGHGPIDVRQFETENEVRAAYQQLEDMYESWQKWLP
jgi:uncharacterized protein (DUF1800 family)